VKRIPPDPLPPGHDPAWPTPRERNAGALFGFCLALIVMKLGNPVIFASRPGQAWDPLAAPASLHEALIATWPVSWGYALLALLGVAALLQWRRPASGWPWPGLLLVGWLGWQVVSATQTVDAALTRATVLHFAGCVACAAVGWGGWSGLRDLRPVWLGLGAGVLVVLATAWDQHFGGLERTRAAFLQLPEAVRARIDSPEFRVKLSSQRVFGTFVYPNALAGGVLLLVPPVLAALWTWRRRPQAGRALAVLLGVAAAGALYWSGSKSGWLLALGLGALALMAAPLRPFLRWTCLAVLLGAGLLAFLGRHAGYFEKGASSLAARRDYWRVAWTLTEARPLLGYGPGTFQVPYRELKPPEAEMARLAHNDYLQQGCDAGVPALLLYAGFIGVSLVALRPAFLRVGSRPGGGGGGEPVATAVWLGLLGFAGQGMVEFGLYIPALAWPFFLFLGWAWGRRSAGPATA
jgi:O-antigen ligase